MAVSIYGNYGNYQSPWGTGWNPQPTFPGCYCPGPYGPPPNPWNNSGHWNLPNATVGQHGFLGLNRTEGFGVDLNQDGRYTRGQDGVLAMDLNRDGRITPDEIEKSREKLKAMGGNFDLNGDGRVTPTERSKGAAYQREMQQYDRNGDGRLSAGEFANAGGRVLVDRNRDGRFDSWESHSPFNFPTPGFGRGRINFIDPYGGGTSVHNYNRPWGPPPFYR